MAIDVGRGEGDRGGGLAPVRFSSSEAAFTGLRLLTREPRTWLIWAALCLAFSLMVGVLLVTTAGPAMMQMMAMQQTRPVDPTASLALMGRLAPFYGLTMVVSLVFYAVAFAAVNRAVLRPAPSGFAHLALGGDELRQFIVLILLGLVLLGVYIAALIVGAVVGIALVFAATAAHVSGVAAGGLGALLFVAVAFGVLGTLLFVMTRLSMTSPLALDTGRIDLGASWRMTRGRFWALFGAYLLAWLVSVVILIGVGVVFAVLAVTMGGGLKTAGFMFRPDMSSLQAYFGPLQLGWMIANAALAPVLFALSLGAPAGAYAQLRATSPTAAVPTTPPSDLPRFGR